MPFTRGQAQPFPFSLIKKTSGDAFTDSDGTPSVYFTIDSNAQQTAGGTPVYQGNGQWLITFTGSEVQGSTMGILCTHADVIPEHTTVDVVAEQDTFQVQSVVTVSSSGTSISGTFEYYGTLAAGEDYFNYRLGSDAWDQAIIKDREKALIAATRLIDKLNFENSKADDDQNLQFPRGDDTTVPVEIEFACYEITIKLLEGVDNEVEAQSLGVLTETYTGVRTTYQAGFVNEHLRAGIPSIEAWEYLKPFLRDSKRIQLARIS
jgi:hypothetical protein